MGKPNVLLILTDQQRRSGLGCYGSPLVQTPAIDSLAREGILFENSFVSNPVCMPSRASLLTGRYPAAHGVKTNGIPLPPAEITLAEILRRQGYRTAAVGKIHLSPYAASREKGSPESRAHWESGGRLPLPYYGFEEARVCAGSDADWMDYSLFLRGIDESIPELLKIEHALRPPSGAPSSWKSAIPEQYHASTWIGDQCIALLERYAAGPDPFFMHVSFPDPHFPFAPPAPYCDMYDPAAVPLPRRSKQELSSGSPYQRIRLEKLGKALGRPMGEMPEDYIREIIAHTFGMTTLVDRNVGRIVRRLEELGLAENTIVIFTSDHGEHLGDHWLLYKCAVYDELIRVPLIWKLPGPGPKGRKVQGLASLIDVLPTLVDLLGIPSPQGVQGQSFRAALEGKGPEGKGPEGKSWRGRESVIVQDDDPSTGDCSRTLRTERYRLTRYANLGIGELFDLRADPDEFVNLYDRPEARGLQAKLTLMLLDRELQSMDPLPAAWGEV